jgi:hypothetical protein
MQNVVQSFEDEVLDGGGFDVGSTALPLQS